MLQRQIDGDVVVSDNGSGQHAKCKSCGQLFAVSTGCRRDRKAGCRDGSTQADSSVKVVEWKPDCCEAIFGDRIQFRHALFGNGNHDKQRGAADPCDEKQEYESAGTLETDLS